MKDTIKQLVDNKVEELMEDVDRYCGITARTHDRMKVLAIANSYDDLFGPDNKFGDPELIELYFLTSENDIRSFNNRVINDIEAKFKEGNSPGTINKYINDLINDIAVKICRELVVKMAIKYSLS